MRGVGGEAQLAIIGDFHVTELMETGSSEYTHDLVRLVIVVAAGEERLTQHHLRNNTTE